MCRWRIASQTAQLLPGLLDHSQALQSLQHISALGVLRIVELLKRRLLYLKYALDLTARDGAQFLAFEHHTEALQSLFDLELDLLFETAIAGNY